MALAIAMTSRMAASLRSRAAAEERRVASLSDDSAIRCIVTGFSATLRPRLSPVRLLLATVLLLLCLPAGARAALYTVSKVDERLYAAIADPNGPVASNAFIVVMPTHVLVAGAHFTDAAAAEITRIVAGITPLPLRYLILTHHHEGYPAIDAGFPPTVEIITSAQTWAKLRKERQSLRNPVISFDRGMTLHGGKQTVLVNGMDAGHTVGNLVVYLPDQAVLFTSDLVFNDEAGFLADGSARGWLQDLQQLENLFVTRVVPGRGKVTDNGGIRRFRIFLQEFLTEVLGRVERKESVAETVRTFSLGPEMTPGNFSRYLQENVRWAWREVQER